MSNSLDRRFTAWIFGIAFAVPTAAAWWLVLAGSDGGSISLAAVLTSITVLGIALASRSPRPGWFLGAAMIGLMLLWPEMVLRVGGYRADSAGVVQFGYPRPEHMVHLRRDPQLFWTLPPGGMQNAEGFRGREWTIPRPKGWFRVALFGDSCTYQPYAKTLRLRLARKLTGVEYVDTVNLGVPGYSTYQGRILVERWAETLDPQVAVIQFGWNDHWLAYGAPDAEKAATFAEPAGPLRCLDDVRLFRWALAATARPSRPLDVPRVSLEEYRSNLDAIGDRLEELGIAVVAIVAPTTHRRLGVPDYLVEGGFASSADRVLEWHDAYGEATREVARERGWHLLDLAARVEEMDHPERLFTEDGIHFTRAGLDWVAGGIAETIASEIAVR